MSKHPKPGGWLKNPERRARRDRAFTFTDDDASKMIVTIEEKDHYISMHLPKEFDETLRLRDKALISLSWIFFKRAKEILGVKRKDVIVAETKLIVTFTVQKKTKRFKLCRECDTKNGFKNKCCRECGENIEDVAPFTEGKPKIVTKTKTKQNKFVKYVTDWVQKLDEIKPKGAETMLFPPLRVVFTSATFDFHHPMTVENFNRILQRLDPTMTSSLFRYGGAEKYLRRGFSREELKEIGDWSTSYMPERYAERKGLTPSQQKWSDDPQ